MIKKTFSIPIPTLFSFAETLSFLDRGFDECLYELSETSVSRVIPFDNEIGRIRIAEKAGSLELEVYKKTISTEDMQLAKEYVIDWFDLERDIEPFYDLLKNNNKLSHLAKDYHGSRIIGIPSVFEALCWAVIGQQINLTFAYKLKRALVEKYGMKFEIDGVVYFRFPTPETLAELDRDVLIRMKYSKQKINYIINISNAFLKGEVNKSILLNCENKEERILKLTSIKGIGIWSANYVLMKSLRDESCITYGDSGLNKAIHTIFNSEKRPSKETVDTVFKEFKGWESYLNFYFWKSLS